MKRVFALLLSIVCVFALIGCGNKTTSGVSIDYGTSSIYTEEDMNNAIELIKREFNTWDGCELHSISYSSDDECSNESSIEWMNELEEANDAKETYADWEWWLARSDSGQWKLMTWGYQQTHNFRFV